MSFAASLAVIRPDRQLEVLDSGGRSQWTTGATPQVLWASWSAASVGDDALYSWPTWAPDGRTIACFRSPRDSGVPELVQIEANGVRTDVVARFADRVPIYVQWAPGGGSLAALTQLGQRLALTLVRPQASTERELLNGSPLFFNWADPTHIAVFVGTDEDTARIGLLDVDSGRFDLLPGRPGNFCAPIQVRGRIGYVADHEGRISIWVADRAAANELEEVEGLVALLPSPSGATLARAIAPNERSPYRDLRLLDPVSGATHLLDDEPCTAFFWTPDGTRLILARTDERSGVVAFSALDVADRTQVHLGDVRPTRDLRFYLRFFEQFAASHPLVDPESKYLVVPGELDRAANTAGIWRLPLDGGAPDRVGDGLLAVWGPPG